MSSTSRRRIREFYRALFKAYGPQGWWPGQTRVEIIVGAILTQNTNWKNVERAIANLRAAKMLDWKLLRDVELPRLAELIRPAGYYNVKAKRLKHFVEWLWQSCGGDLNILKKWPLSRARRALLEIHGIGPETADSILLYALDLPTFVVDAYTRRLATRHGLVKAGAGYDELKAIFESNLEPDVDTFNEYHALIVAVAKRHCKTKASCAGCPLERFEHAAE